MKEQKWNENWKFWLDKDAFALVWDLPGHAEDVTLPHDAMAAQKADPGSPNKGNTGFRDGGIYNYVNLFFAPEEYRDKTVALKFEGVYMNTFVYVNGQLAGKRPYGYSGFSVSLDGLLNYGQENEIRVQVRNSASPNGRWYTGGGIYRDVYLLTGNLCHMVHEGVHVVCEEADGELAVLNISTELKNRGHRKASLRLEMEILGPDKESAAADVSPAVLFEGEECIARRRVVVPKPMLWDEAHPNLYTCVSRLYEDQTLIDESSTVFGIRTMTVDAKRGLRINGESVKLRGVCIHHDSGLLGAATYEDAQYRQIQKLKEAGINAVRMAHNPMAPAMLRACDALGMYVMDESFDMWTRLKSDYDYGLYFDEWWEKDLEAMVRKDRNHPSVILYSLGNEIPEIGTDYGAGLCRKMAEKVRSMDDKRFTLASINGVFASGDAIGEIVSDVAAGAAAAGKPIQGNVNDFMSIMDSHMDDIVVHPAVSSRLEKACAATDIAGYNYMTARYELDREENPNRVIVGSETYPPDIARNWEIIMRNPHVIGDFTWTGWDYIGEAGVGIPAYSFGEGGFGAQFPCQLAYCGDFDLTGLRRPASYLREIVFGLRKDPYIAVQNPFHYGEPLIKTPWIISDSVNGWDYPGMENKPAVVEIYAAGEEAELFLNNRSMGRKPAGAAAGYIVKFETIYEPGTLVAISYEKGEEIGRTELKSAGESRSLRLRQEEHFSRELIYLWAEILDGQGTIATDEMRLLEISVTHGAALLGFGSGDPKPAGPYNTTGTKTFHGQALAILKRDNTGRPVHVLARDEKGCKTEITIA